MKSLQSYLVSLSKKRTKMDCFEEKNTIFLTEMNKVLNVYSAERKTATSLDICSFYKKFICARQNNFEIFPDDDSHSIYNCKSL